jgi:hypothetical protein
MVLLSQDNTDLEFWMLRPRQAAKSELTPPEEFAARKLRSVGIVGLCGLKPRCAFKEPLETPIVNKIAAAFLEYLRVLLGGQIAEQTEAAEIAELERLYGLPSGRPN